MYNSVDSESPVFIRTGMPRSKIVSDMTDTQACSALDRDRGRMHVGLVDSEPRCVASVQEITGSAANDTGGQ